MDNGPVRITTRSAHEMRPDPSRIVLRPFLLEPGPGTQARLERMVGRVLDMPEDIVVGLVDELRGEDRVRLFDGVGGRQVVVLAGVDDDAAPRDEPS